MVLVLLVASGASAFVQNDPEEKEWRQLFNGRNPDGWDVKITGYTLNENSGKTFRVENGVLETYYVQSDDARCRYQRGGRQRSAWARPSRSMYVAPDAPT